MVLSQGVLKTTRGEKEAVAREFRMFHGKIGGNKMEKVCEDFTGMRQKVFKSSFYMGLQY